MDSFQNFMQKASALLESPQLVNIDYNEVPRQVSEPNLYSDTVLSEQYTYLSTIESENVTVDLYEQIVDGKYLILGVTQSDDHPKYKHGIFSINLQELTYPDDKLKELGSPILSVNLVYNKNEYRYKGLSSKVYALLAQHGYVVISDELHYKGAKNLWKRLAYLSGLVKVRVYDSDVEQFVKGSDGSELYNGSNIPDDIIWSSDSSKMTVQLVLSTR